MLINIVLLLPKLDYFFKLGMTKSRIFTVSIFAIAMGLLEAAVVIYLRLLMYPNGFGFPLAPILPGILTTEILREVATILMLLTVGILAGRNPIERFAWFIYSFAIWDIFYYIFLKILIAWPDSFMTNDVLFLIPATWVGPVLAPIIVSLLMILLAMIILAFSNKSDKIKIRKIEWAGLILGSIILITGFIWEYSRFMLERFKISDLLFIRDRKAITEQAQLFVPVNFNWILFVIAILFIQFTIVKIYFRLKADARKNNQTELF